MFKNLIQLNKFARNGDVSVCIMTQNLNFKFKQYKNAQLSTLCTGILEYVCKRQTGRVEGGSQYNFAKFSLDPLMTKKRREGTENLFQVLVQFRSYIDILLARFVLAMFRLHLRLKLDPELNQQLVPTGGWQLWATWLTTHFCYVFYWIQMAGKILCGYVTQQIHNNESQNTKIRIPFIAKWYTMPRPHTKHL